MARVTVFGGTGYAGAHLVREAVARGHEVRAVTRRAPEAPVPGAEYVEGDARDAVSVREAVAGADVVLASLSPRGDMAGRLVEAVGVVADAAREAGARLGVVGGAGSLRTEPGGPLVVDTPGVVDEYKPESREMGYLLDALRADDTGLDWFFVSPAIGFGSHAPGERTGAYRVGGDTPVYDAQSTSYISGEDLAVAFLDEVEKPAHHRERFTVGY